MMQSLELISNQIKQVKEIIKRVEYYQKFDLQALNYKPNTDCWNTLECIEHLNRYSAFYLPKIQNKINNSKLPQELSFKFSWLGSYFCKMMLPQHKIKKMKTFKDKNPINEILDLNVIDIFLNHQNHTLQLLEHSRKISLRKIKIPTTIASFIKLNLGDTFQFIINHNLRHLAQIDNIMLAYKNE
jgi:hypothetical protein